MSDLDEAAKAIGRMGFDAELSKNLIEMVTISFNAGREQAAEECAKIAEDHVGGAGKIDEDATVLAGAVASAYDEACRDIAKAIRDTYGVIGNE